MIAVTQLEVVTCIVHLLPPELSFFLLPGQFLKGIVLLLWSLLEDDLWDPGNIIWRHVIRQDALAEQPCHRHCGLSSEWDLAQTLDTTVAAAKQFNQLFQIKHNVTKLTSIFCSLCYKTPSCGIQWMMNWKTMFSVLNKISPLNGFLIWRCPVSLEILENFHSIKNKFHSDHNMIPFSCFSFKVLVLRMLARCHGHQDIMEQFFNVIS